MNYKLLIVEDDVVIATEIKKYLSAWGYELKSVVDFTKVSTFFVAYQPHLVLMDISLPFYNGYHWCKEIRKVSQVPIVFISSANDKMDIVMAMNMGGDDFISKPFSLEVLLAKIQAMLRRTYSFHEGSKLLEYKGTFLNCSNASLEVNGEKVELTKNEFRILQLLFENKGEVVTRETIMKSLWDDESFIDDNTLAVNFTRLRKKLDEQGLKNYITTKKGIGYLLEEERV